MINSKEVKILGIAIDWKLSFHQHTKVFAKQQAKNLVYYWEFPHTLTINKRSFLQHSDQIQIQFLPASLDVLFGKKSIIRSSAVNLPGQFKQFPNIAKSNGTSRHKKTCNF